MNKKSKYRVKFNNLIIKAYIKNKQEKKDYQT